MIAFTTCNNSQRFERMNLDRLVVNISFAELMIKLKHQDRSWFNSQNLSDTKKR